MCWGKFFQITYTSLDEAEKLIKNGVPQITWDYLRSLKLTIESDFHQRTFDKTKAILKWLVEKAKHVSDIELRLMNTEADASTPRNLEAFFMDHMEPLVGMNLKCITLWNIDLETMTRFLLKADEIEERLEELFPLIESVNFMFINSFHHHAALSENLGLLKRNRRRHLRFFKLHVDIKQRQFYGITRYIVKYFARNGKLTNFQLRYTNLEKRSLSDGYRRVGELEVAKLTLSTTLEALLALNNTHIATSNKIQTLNIFKINNEMIGPYQEDSVVGQCTHFINVNKFSYEGNHWPGNDYEIALALRGLPKDKLTSIKLFALSHPISCIPVCEQFSNLRHLAILYLTGNLYNDLAIDCFTRLKTLEVLNLGCICNNDQTLLYPPSLRVLTFLCGTSQSTRHMMDMSLTQLGATLRQAKSGVDVLKYSGCCQPKEGFKNLNAIYNANRQTRCVHFKSTLDWDLHVKTDMNEQEYVMC
uniref:FBD domain-containing protein n=1 Tax=Rhabditophanes sp. KR3021 TaxID=114890 RepID=A0AC35TFR9_9BILA